jgi:multiple antibiotic resistance protein
MVESSESIPSLVSAALLLFLVFDPLGNMPVFVAHLEPVDPGRRTRVILRELLIALVLLLAFLFVGQSVLTALRVRGPSLPISGGVVLFLIALRMIFPQRHQWGEDEDVRQEPLIVPLAVPLVAGPSALATILLLVSQWPDYLLHWLAAVLIAWAVTTVLLLLAPLVARWLGRRAMLAIERLMGLLLVTVAVQMFLDGVEQFMQVMQDGSAG